MRKLQVQPAVILGASIFTGFFVYLIYLTMGLFDSLVLQIVTVMMGAIIYVNVLKFFVFEFCSVGDSRMSEYLLYFAMYALTITLFALPFITEPVEVQQFAYIRTVMMTLAALFFIKFFIYMFIGPIYDIRRAIRHHVRLSEKHYTPLVSVIVPAWNEGVGLVHTVKSILKSTYRKVEIVVINDGSSDNSDHVMRSFVSAHQATNPDISIVYRYQENTGKGGALNHAISLAKGDIIVSIDADCLVDKQAIGEFVETFKDEEVMAAVGNVKIANKNHSIGLVQYLEFLFSFYFKRADALMGAIYIIGGAAGAFRKEVFEQLGGYVTENITEDIELTVRMQDAGMKIDYTPEAVVYTEGAADLAGLKKQRLRWKRGRFETFYQYIHMFFSTKRHHNKALTFGLMPLAILQEIQLLFEIPFIITLYVYSVLNHEFTSLMVAVFVVGMMFVVQFMFYDKSTRNVWFLLMAPIGWILFYVATYVEAYALVQSIRSFVFGQKVTWQKWERKGIGHIVETA